MQRIIKTFALTGLGYAATLLYTYLVIATADAETVSMLNKYESFLTILMSLITLGVVQDASRNIALNGKAWTGVYFEAQGFRLLLALVISLVCFSIYIVTGSEIYVLAIASVAMALSGEYALYAIGRPVAASAASFVRAIVFSGIVVAVLVTGAGLNVYTVTSASTFSFVICGIVASRALGVRYLVPPKASIQLFKTVSSIAIIVLIYSNIKPAYIFIISDNITKEENVYYFEVFKLYFIIFSVRRVMVQILYKEIIAKTSSIKYDLIIFSIIFLTCTALWIAKILIDYSGMRFSGLSWSVLKDVTIMALFASIFSPSFTRLFSLKKDFLIVPPVIIAVFYVVAGVKILEMRGADVSHYLYLLGSVELVLSFISFLILKLHVSKKTLKTTL